MEIKLVSSHQDLMQYIPAWEELAAAALEPNPFYEHWTLLPAIRNLQGDRELTFVLIFDRKPGRPPEEDILCGFFPLERHRRYMGTPITGWAMWKHRHCFLTTPLLRAASARECLAAFFDWLKSSQDCQLMEFRHVPGEGRFSQLLVDQFTRLATIPLMWECFTRAFFQPRETADAYLGQSLTTKQRSEMRRRARLLSESGRFEYKVLETEDNLARWSESFLELEGAGWKGHAGSSLASQPGDRAFFLETAAAAFQKGKLLMPALTLNDVPIAQHCFFLSGGAAFYFKTGFDENYSKFAPGFYLECETIRYLHSRPDIRWMDTCTSADNEMYNRLFLDRRTIQTVLVPVGKGVSGLVISTLPLLRSFKRSIAAFRNRAPKPQSTAPKSEGGAPKSESGTRNPEVARVA